MIFLFTSWIFHHWKQFWKFSQGHSEKWGYLQNFLSGHPPWFHCCQSAQHLNPTKYLIVVFYYKNKKEICSNFSKTHVYEMYIWAVILLCDHLIYKTSMVIGPCPAQGKLWKCSNAIYVYLPFFDIFLTELDKMNIFSIILPFIIFDDICDSGKYFVQLIQFYCRQLKSPPTSLKSLGIK